MLTAPSSSSGWVPCMMNCCALASQQTTLSQRLNKAPFPACPTCPSSPLQDKYGAIYTAVLDPSAPGGYALAKQPRAHLSQGRPMGGALDRDGNILIANCGQVGCCQSQGFR